MAKTRRDKLAEKLTLQQQKAAFLLIDNETKPVKEQRSQDDIAEEIGIARMTLYNWRTKNQTFIEYKKEIAKDFLGDAVGVWANAIIQSMRGTNGAPSQKALDLYAKLMGFIQDQKRIEITDGNDTRSDEEIKRQLAELDALLDDKDDK